MEWNDGRFHYELLETLTWGSHTAGEDQKKLRRWKWKRWYPRQEKPDRGHGCCDFFLGSLLLFTKGRGE